MGENVVLVAASNPVILKAVYNRLMSKKLNVHDISSVEDVIRMAKSLTRLDFLVIDFSLSSSTVTDGFELAEKVLSIRSDVRGIVIMSYMSEIRLVSLTCDRNRPFTIAAHRPNFCKNGALLMSFADEVTRMVLAMAC